MQYPWIVQEEQREDYEPEHYSRKGRRLVRQLERRFQPGAALMSTFPLVVFDSFASRSRGHMRHPVRLLRDGLDTIISSFFRFVIVTDSCKGILVLTAAGREVSRERPKTLSYMACMKWKNAAKPEPGWVKAV